METMVGDILAAGIIRTGLKKVGSDPDTATPDMMKKAIDAHIGMAIESFVGTEKARMWAIRTKGAIDKNNGASGGS